MKTRTEWGLRVALVLLLSGAALAGGACGIGGEERLSPSVVGDERPGGESAAALEREAAPSPAMPPGWEARRSSRSLPTAWAVGRFEGEVDPFGGASALRFIPGEAAGAKSDALPGVGRSPRVGSQLELTQDVEVLGYSTADCGADYWDPMFASEGPQWRFWLDEGLPRDAFYQRLLLGPPDSDGEAALRFCTDFTLRNGSSNTYGDLWLMFDGIALERGYAFVDRVPRRLEEMGPDGTDLEYAPVSDRGMFNYGPLEPSEEVTRQWYFYRAPGSTLQRFRVSGDVVELLHEQCGTGTDDNGDGVVDSGCGTGRAASACHFDWDCLSAACSDADTSEGDFGDWTTGTCDPSADGGGCFDSSDCDPGLLCIGGNAADGTVGQCLVATSPIGTTLEPIQEGDDIRLRANLDAVGVPPAEGVGFCYGAAPAPRDGDAGVTCVTVGDPGPGPGPFELLLPDRVPGETIHVAALAQVDGAFVYFGDRTTAVLPGQVTGVQAVNVTSAGADLQWNSVPGAVAYRVYLEGLEAAEVSETNWAIAGLPEPPRATPQNLSASRDEAGLVRVQWDALPAPTSGPARELHVTAVAPNDVEGPMSTPVSVARAAYTPQQLVMERTVGGVPVEFALAASDTSLDDVSAPAPTLNAPGTPTATQGTLLGEVEVAGVVLAPSPGAPVTYRLKRVYSGGVEGDYSASSDGWRTLDEVTLRLLSGPTAANTPDELLSQATPVSMFEEGEFLWFPRDERATPVETRWYRFEVSAPGFTPVLSPSASGIPGAAPVVTLQSVTPDPIQARATLVGQAAAFAPIPGNGQGCWHPVGGDVPVCTINSPTSPGEMTRLANTGLLPGRRYEFWLQVSNMHGTGASEKTPALLAPSAPTGVTASTTFEDFVRVSWDDMSPQEVDEFRIFRDGAQVGAVPGSTTSWDHTEAPAGTVAAPTNLQATGAPYWVDVSWNTPTSSPGPAAVYTVRAVNATGTSAASTGATGRRAAPTITQIRVTWAEAGGGGHEGSTNLGAGATTYRDSAAPGVTRASGALAATDGTFLDRVRVTISGFGISAAPSVAYTVQALTALGPGSPSNQSGSRTHNGNTFNYEVSTDGGMTWTSLSFGDPDTTYDDFDAPSDGTSQTYRAAVFTDGIPGWELTNTAVGARGVPVVWTAFDAGQFHVCGVASNGRAYCWGDYWDYNANGILGSPGSAAGSPRQVSGGYTDWFDVTCNQLHCCGLRGDPASGGSAWCWGSNTASRLGRSGGTSNVPVAVTDSPSDLVTIAASQAMTCAVRSNGQLWCWGTGVATCASETAAHCDSGHAYTTVTGGRATTMMARRTNGTWIGWGSNANYGLLRSSGSGIAALGGGHDYSYIIGSRDQSHFCGLDGTTLRCWGMNHHWQTHHPTKNQNVSDFQSAPYTLPQAWSAMGCGGDACCGWHIAEDELRCWGLNLNGQLGVTPGSPTDRRAKLLMPTYDGAPIVSVRGGRLFLCALDEDGDIWCWGSNGAGTRANGTSGGSFATPNRITPP